MLNIITLPLGELETNCYLVSDSETLETFIIDPADEGTLISERILSEKLKPIAIILTHGHFDHVLACLEIKLNFGIPIYLHPLDNFLLKDTPKSAKYWLGHSVDPVPPADLPLSDNQILSLGNEKVTVLHTPGHTPGSICLLHTPKNLKSKILNHKSIFVGDLIFSDGVGRTDFSYSSESDLQNSINLLNSQLLTLNSKCLIYPGHGDPFPL